MKTFEQIEMEVRAYDMLNNMMHECANDMLGVGIPVHPEQVKNIHIGTVKGSRAACFYRMGADARYAFIISIDKGFLKHMDNNAVMANVKESMYHELLHTCDGCQTHNAAFLEISTASSRQICNKSSSTSSAVATTSFSA